MARFDGTRDRFIDTLYALAVEEDFASAVLPHLAGVFGTSSSNAAVMDTRTLSYTQHIFGIDPKLLETNGAHFFPQNPWVKAGFDENAANPTAYAQPTVRTGAELVPYRVYRESEYYRDFNRFTGVGDDMMAMFLPIDHRTVALAVSAGGRLFDAEERAGAQSLLSDLSRAVRLHLRVAMRGGGPDLGWHSKSAVGLISVRDDVVVEANRAAQTLIDAGVPIKLSASRLSFGDKQAQDAFCAMRKKDAPPARACIVQDEAERWLVQFVRRKKPELLRLLRIDEPLLSIVIQPLNAAAAARRRSIDGFVDLTAAEREILAHLVNGLDIPAIARQSGRTRETVRSHVASLRAKFGARTTLDLARTGALLLPF